MNYLFIFPAIPFILELILLVICGGLAGGLIGTLIGIIIGALSPKDACSIAIFGSGGSGKTTLWEQLRGVFENKQYETTLIYRTINKFEIEYNGKKKVVEKSKDFGGNDEMVKHYESIIKEGTFIYYLINLNKLNEYKRETRGRLAAIAKIIEKKSLQGKVGLRLVATHYGEYLRYNPHKSADTARYELVHVIGLDEPKYGDITNQVMVAELTNANDIKQFYEQICK